MRKNNTILLCAQPCIIYYAWQLEVMLYNFRKVGIDAHEVHCLIAYNKTQDNLGYLWDIFKRIESRYSDFAKFYFYEDTRMQPIRYISSIRPNVMWQHFYQNPELSERVIFYHDCDIVFTKYPDFFEKCEGNDRNWYVSDTISYIGHKYIKSKGQDVLDGMLNVFGINEKFIEERENQSGGAQYIMKGVDWRFFKKIQDDCEKLFYDITLLNNEKRKEDPTYHELQIWCSDMWALLWNAWMRGFTTEIIPELDFCWATDSIENWDKKYIFHNAGVVAQSREDLFFKGDYTDKTPYHIIHNNYNKDRATSKYFDIILEVGKSSAIHP